MSDVREQISEVLPTSESIQKVQLSNYLPVAMIIFFVCT